MQEAGFFPTKCPSVSVLDDLIGIEIIIFTRGFLLA